jgi:hypothetical protein
MNHIVGKEAPVCSVRLLAFLVVASLVGFTVPARAATVTIGERGEFRVDGEPFLPIMQWLQSASRIEYQKTLGINTFVGNGGSDSSAEYLAECRAQGVWCVLDPEDMSVSDDPALLGWIFGDEPDLDSNAVEPERILEQYESIKAQDDAHVTLLTVTSGFFSEMDPPDWMNGDRGRYHAYADATDAVGFDLYPVYGWCRPDWLYRVGAAQEELITQYAPDRSTYQWIECVRTSSQWCDIDEREPDDGPTAAEVRNQVWQAIAHGAKAIGYFTHSWECDDYTQYCLSAAQETELTRTNAQITALTVPILSAPYERAVTVTSTPEARIDWLARHVGNEVTLIVVNVDAAAVEVSVHVPGLSPGGSVEVYDEERSLSPDSETFTDAFDALGVHVYRMPVESSSPEGGAGGSAGSAGSANGGNAADDEPDGGAGTPGTATDESESDEGGCGCATPAGRVRTVWVHALALLMLLVHVASRRMTAQGQPVRK